VKALRQLLLLTLVLSLPALACASLTREGPPSNAVVIEVMANSALVPWFEAAVQEFNDSRTETEDGKPVYVELNPVEAGQAVTFILDERVSPALWVPDESVWVDLLATEGEDGFQDCVSIAESPLVIAMWRPVAESLGWPARELGWLDVGSLAADPSAWDYYSGGQFGPSLRLGHTHPGLSGSGTKTLLAVVQAAQSKIEAVTVDDIQEPIVQASVGAFEGAVSWFSASTNVLGETMRERGVDFLGASVMYESTVVHYGDQEPGIVPIYPFEGTYMATFPACIDGDADALSIEGATLFRGYLLGEEGQEMAMESGFRPVNDQVPLAEPLDESRGVEATQPEILFEAPSVEAVYAVQELWQSARKNVNLIMLLDVSGSMEGDKIRNVRQSAIQFVDQMGEKDFLTLIAFSNSPAVLAYHEEIGTSREDLILMIQRLSANGDTTLYDAIGVGAATIGDTTSSQTSNVMVVLTDGMDTASQYYSFNDSLIELAVAYDTTIFTIAYGSDADEGLLSRLAERARGNFYLGDEASIAEIYQEMSAAFGGSVGIGR
jgi:Ca-activated chloride channel family protein